MKECFVIRRGDVYWTLNNAASHWSNFTNKPELAIRYADEKMANDIIRAFPDQLAGAKVAHRTVSETVIR